VREHDLIPGRLRQGARRRAACPASGRAARVVVAGVGLALGVALGLAAPAQAHAQAVTATPGLDLDALVLLALKHNRRVEIDRARIDEARALYDLAAAQALPRLSGQLLFAGPISEAQTRVLNDLSTVTPASLEQDADFGKLGVTMRITASGGLPLYTFGKISSAKEAASHLTEAATTRVEITESEVILNVVRAYWAFQVADAAARSLDEGDAIVGKILKKVKELLDDESAQVTEADRMRIQHAQATLRVRANEAELGRRNAIAALKILIGRPQPLPLEVAPRALDELPPTPPPLGLLLDGLNAKRPETRALESLVRAQESLVELRTAQLYPDVVLGFGLDAAYTTNATNQTNPFIYDPYNFIGAGVAAVLRFELDVFNKLALITQAEAELRSRLRESEATQEAVTFELTKLHQDLAAAHARLTPADGAFRASKSWLVSAVLAYDVGTGNARELIDAFFARAMAENDLLRAQFEIQTVTADLDRAAGLLVAEARARARGGPVPKSLAPPPSPPPEPSASAAPASATRGVAHTAAR
jgi:outer membrane protein TolC